MKEINIPILPTGYEEFSAVKIYGSIEEPKFLTTDVEKLLGIGRIHLHRDYKEGEDYIKIKVPHKGQNRILTAMTEHGLYQVIYSTPTEAGRRFRMFVTIILKELRLNGVVELETAKKKLAEQLDSERQKREQLEAQMNEEHEKLVRAEHEKETFFNRMTTAQTKLMAAQHSVNMSSLWGRGSAEYKLEQMKEKFFRPLYVYVEPIPKALECDIAPYDDEPHESDTLILSLSLTKRKSDEIAIIRIPPRIRSMTEVEEVLHDYQMDGRKNRYHTSVETLSEVLDNLEL